MTRRLKGIPLDDFYNQTSATRTIIRSLPWLNDIPDRRDMASSSPSGGEPPSLDTTSSDPTTPIDADDQQPCHLLRLPVELLLDICDLLPFSDHNDFSRACRYLAPELQKHLYRRAASRGYHSLLYAFRENRLDIIQRSLEYGFPPSVDDPIFEPRAIFYYFHVRSNLFGFPTKKCTLLGAAIKARSVPAVKYILSRGATLLESGSTCTPLVLAVRESCQGVVQAILEHGADPNQVAVEVDKDSESNSRTPLTEALTRIHEILQTSGRTVVFDAVWKPLFDHLLNSGADPSLPYGDGVTPLGIARRIALGFQHSHNPGFAEALLERGADPNQPVRPGGPAAFLLAIMDDCFRQPADRVRLIEKMIEAGADVNARYDDKAPPLIAAMIYCLLLETRRVAEEEADDDAYKWFSATRDFHRLLDLYHEKKKKPGFAEIDEYEEIDLVWSVVFV
ncbi:ankyrin repeat-containing domain protein [Coniochaeta sp. 2T2.1]|nr:ankyrin repeat-containing domain protein [Coniochaeta sp. 2T2.1]